MNAGSLGTRMAAALFRRFPPRPADLIFKTPRGRADSEYQDEVASPTWSTFGEGPQWLSGKDVLDLGSGFGGRTVRYAETGVKSAVGVEVSDDHVDEAQRFAAGLGSAARFVVGTAEAIPLPSDSIDIIIMNDVMEHVVDPAKALEECRRVLRTGGEIAVTFPPYYALDGGSHLHGFATRLPGLNLLFSTVTLKQASEIVLKERNIDYRPYFRDCPSDKIWNMNGLTVRAWNRMVRRSGLRPRRKARLGFLDHRLSKHRGWRRTIRMPFYLTGEVPASIPIVREALCARIADILVKD